jgi:uncharacterized tellurite resistance protein B-like protein
MSTSAKQLLKLLIGVAWLDGKVQSEEQTYLRNIAQKEDLLDDPDLHPLLHGLRAVSTEECYRWIDEYLGKHPKPEDVHALLEEISGLIYSDNDVDSAEAQFLMELQQKDGTAVSDLKFHENLTRAIQKLYRRWVDH